MENITQGQWFRGPSADLGAPINQSLRLRGTQCLHHTFSRSSTGDTATLSFWIKIAKLDREHCFIINKNGNHRFVNVKGANDWCYNAAGGNFTSYGSNHLARDPSAWYHVLVIQDNGTTSLYVNGSQVGNSTNFVSGFWNSTGDNQIIIGAETDSGGGATSVCYLAEYNLLDGTAIGVTNGVPDEFGRFNEDDVWVPKSVSGLTSDQYGADGFRLVFDNSAGLGDDSAPTGGNHASANDFTTVGFETTALSSSNFDNDIDYNDTPTSNYGTANEAGTSVSSFTEASLFVDTSSNGTWQGAYGTFPMQSGKWYWEVEANQSDMMIGISRNHRVAPTYASQPGEIAYRGDGKKWENNSAEAYGNTYTTGDVIGVAFDADNGNIWFSKNDTWQNSGDPAGGTGAAYTSLDDGIYVPLHMNVDTGGQRLNYGQRAFEGTKPSGFEALNTNKLAEPTIKNGKDHFGVLTWTGDGTNGRDITGLNFQPDLVWIKRRNGGNQHNLYDSVRGVTKHLTPDNSYAQTTTANSLTAFNTDGIEVGTGASDNTSSSTYVAWCWKADDAWASTDSDVTAGTIASSGRRNTDTGFSMVKWTGNGNNNASVGHGLSQAPDFVIVKNYDQASNSWVCWHSSIPTKAGIIDDNTAFQTSGYYVDALNGLGSSVPSSTVINISASGRSNNSNSSNGDGYNHIAYCWHEVEGYSRIGMWTGNASTDGPFVYCGFKPQFLLFKWSDGTSYWQIRDAARDPENPVTNELYPATTETENTHSSTREIDFLSNGFKIRNGGGALNTSGGEFIFMAFAEHPFGGVNTPPVTAR